MREKDTPTPTHTHTYIHTHTHTHTHTEGVEEGGGRTSHEYDLLFYLYRPNVCSCKLNYSTTNYIGKLSCTIYIYILHV